MSGGSRGEHMSSDKQAQLLLQASIFFQDMHDMIDEQYEKGMLTKKNYYRIRKIIDEDWDYNMVALSPQNRFPALRQINQHLLQ